MLAACRRRSIWEVGRSGAAALQQAAVRSAAAAGSGGGEAGGSSSSGSGYRGGRSSRGGSSSGSRSGGRVAGGSRSGGSGGGSGAGSSSGEPWQHEHKEDVRQIRSVLKEYYKRKGGRRLKGARPEAATSSSSGGSGSAAPRTLPPLRRATAAATEAAPAPQQPSTAALGQGARVQAALARATGVQVLPPLRPGRLAEEEKRRVVPLALSAEARSARLEESVRINKLVCRMFDDLDNKLNAGVLAPADRLRLGQECLDAVGASLHTVMDHINMSTFFHRISRLVMHSGMAPVVKDLDTSRVMPVLVQRFEGLLDRILRSKAYPAAGSTRGGAAAAAAGGGLGGGPGGGKGAGLEPELILPVRSLATSFWALGNMRYPLTSEQLDKIAGVLTLKYAEIKPDHLSMLLMGLNAYPEARFSSKLQRLLLECCVHMPLEQFEARVATNLLCAAASSKVVPSLDVIERLSLLALAALPECDNAHLGSLTWAIGKLGCRVGKSRIDPALLHAITATVWRNLDAVQARPLSNVLYGFGLLNFHPGTDFLDAAAARLLQLLPDLDTSGVVNVVWSFARLEYSPDPDRELWAIAPSRPAARWTPPVRDGGSWGWEGQEAEAAGASVADREEERWLTTQEQRARAQERAVQGLAQRVAAQRARREAYNRLLAYAREAVTTALARTPAAWKSEGAEAPGKAVREENMADLVHFIHTGQTKRPRKPRVVEPPAGMLPGMEEWIDPKTGIAVWRPYYNREQLSFLPAPLLSRAHTAGEGGAEEEAAASGELHSLDAFAASAAAVDTWQPPEEAEEAAGGSGQAAAVIEDPDLVDAEEEEEEEADIGAPGGGGGSVAAGLELDLDAMQAGEESDDESEEEEEEAAAGGSSGSAAQSSESLADVLLRLREEERAAAAGPARTAGRSARSAAALVARVGNLSPEQLQQLDDPTQQALRQRVEHLRQQRREAAQQRREERAARRAAEAAARAAAADDGQADWREHCDSPEQLRDFLYSDGRRFTVPSSVQKQWRGAERFTFEHAAQRLLPKASRLTGGEVSTVMWSFATARHVHPELFKALLQQADTLADSLAWRSIGIIMWSSAVTMQRPSPQLADRLVDRFGPLFNKHVDQRYDLHALCNLTWSLAVFDYLTPERFSELLSYVPRDSHAYASISTPGWFQFFQCALHLEAKTGRPYSDFLPPELLPHAEQAWTRKETTTSRLQNKVVDVLHSMGVHNYTEEYSPRGKFFSIDIAITDGKLAVEVDGPQHFSANAPHIPLASTCMRNALLASEGWKVVSIPFNAWAQLAGPEQQQEYLREHVLSQLPDYKAKKR